jgi:hypothetical protein
VVLIDFDFLPRFCILKVFRSAQARLRGCGRVYA